MKQLNWKLILELSMFGLAMGVATVYLIPSSIEPLCWLVIFVICAVIIAKKCERRHFLHGFMVSIVNSVWITACHVLLFDSYLARHAREAAMMSSMPMPDSPRLMMLLTGPVVGIISGIVLGLLSFLASRVIR